MGRRIVSNWLNITALTEKSTIIYTLEVFLKVWLAYYWDKIVK